MRGELHSEAACLGCRLTSRRRSFAQYTAFILYRSGELHSEAACLGCRLTSRRRSFAQYRPFILV
jgi:hypothetical protein